MWQIDLAGEWQPVARYTQQETLLHLHPHPQYHHCELDQLTSLLYNQSSLFWCVLVSLALLSCLVLRAQPYA